VDRVALCLHQVADERHIAVADRLLEEVGTQAVNMQDDQLASRGLRSPRTPEGGRMPAVSASTPDATLM
jgi:hypothetical protein